MCGTQRVMQLAERTGLEPATLGVTGRYSNQLNYRSKYWWVLRGSNPRPSPCKGDALPAELSTQVFLRFLRFCFFDQLAACHRVF